MIIYLSALVAAISAVLFFISDPAKRPDLKEFGRITYFAGLFVFLLQAFHVVSALLR